LLRKAIRSKNNQPKSCYVAYSWKAIVMRQCEPFGTRITPLCTPDVEHRITWCNVWILVLLGSDSSFLCAHSPYSECDCIFYIIVCWYRDSQLRVCFEYQRRLSLGLLRNAGIVGTWWLLEMYWMHLILWDRHERLGPGAFGSNPERWGRLVLQPVVLLNGG
jgi:hypothetical protein